MLTLLNLHTHTPLPPCEATIVSQGLHPWHLDSHWHDQLQAIARAAAEWHILGECGLDHACSTPYALQLQAFEAQIALSEALRRPLLLHCVRALDDVLRLRRQASQPWVWHGFRGKPQMLQQVLRAGMHVSFGLHHHPDSLAQCPLDRLFLETDDTSLPITPLYERTATLRGLSVIDLQAALWHNAERLTGLPTAALSC